MARRQRGGRKAVQLWSRLRKTLPDGSDEAILWDYYLDVQSAKKLSYYPKAKEKVKRLAKSKSDNAASEIVTILKKVKAIEMMSSCEERVQLINDIGGERALFKKGIGAVETWDDSDSESGSDGDVEAVVNPKLHGDEKNEIEVIDLQVLPLSRRIARKFEKLQRRNDGEASDELPEVAELIFLNDDDDDSGEGSGQEFDEVIIL
jgi:hypothetical protein